MFKTTVSQGLSLRNYVSGPIPSQLGLLTKAKRIFLGANLLTGKTGHTCVYQLSITDHETRSVWTVQGPIPTELGSLSAITELKLDNNKLTGAQWPLFIKNINKIDADCWVTNTNVLLGNVPPELFQAWKLQILMLNDNSFSGAMHFPNQCGAKSVTV